MTNTTGTVLLEPPFIFKGNRIRDKNGLDVAYLSTDPSYAMSDDDKRFGYILAAAPDLSQCLTESTILIRDALTLIDEKSIVAGCLRKQLEFNESTLRKARGES